MKPNTLVWIYGGHILVTKHVCTTANKTMRTSLSDKSFHFLTIAIRTGMASKHCRDVRMNMYLQKDYIVHIEVELSPHFELQIYATLN